MLSKIWRTFATGTGFVSFGLGGLLVGLVGVPLIHLTAPSAEVAQLRLQRLIRLGFRAFLGVINGLGASRVTWDGAERLDRPGTLVVANHPTLIDACVLMSRMPQCYCVVKQENFQNPFMRSAARAAGYLSNSGGKAVVEDCAQLLREGKSLLLFPEGTRSPEGGMRNFKRGWAHIALEAGVDPIPALITCEPPALMKGQKWYEIPERRFHVHVEVGEPLPVNEIRRGHVSRGRAARALNAALRETFEKGLARVDAG